jgi:hypothetical protein
VKLGVAWCTQQKNINREGYEHDACVMKGAANIYQKIEELMVMYKSKQRTNQDAVKGKGNIDVVYRVQPGTEKKEVGYVSKATRKS